MVLPLFPVLVVSGMIVLSSVSVGCDGVDGSSLFWFERTIRFSSSIIIGGFFLVGAKWLFFENKEETKNRALTLLRR